SFKKQINKDALKPYLTFQYCPLVETFFKDVYRILPGHYFIFEEDKLKIEKFFEPAFTQEYGDLEKSAEKINEIMAQSIRYHKISDVEVGSFLSSGVDSSYIFEESDVDKSYTVWFDNAGFDEHSAAVDLAEMEGKKHQERQVTPEMFFAALDKVQYFSDEPHANLSAVPLYYLAEMAAQDVKVVLSGEGADELFGGYLDYIVSPTEARYKKIPYPIRHLLGSIAKKFPNMKGRNFFVRCGMPAYESYIGQANIMTNEQANKLLKPDFRKKEHYGEICKPTLEKVKNEPEVIQRMFLDLHFFQPYDILLKADKMTMAHSLELRVPFLDKEVFEYSRRLKPELYVNGNITKHAFREAAKKKIPAEWGNRKKAGFMVPFREWIKEKKYYDFVKDYLNKDYAKEFFDIAALNRLLEQHFEGKANNARKIYTVLCFLIWYEQYFVLNTYGNK
ncbi:MAG: asparagine synthase C-terminal domain-containing protein, partial [Enterococcus sp.]|nr:asparagine synthase C-terminal domain-containing protein [Enterococcus sp.]